MEHEHNTLKRGLKNRHVQLIALGGAVGTGLFLGTASTIQMAGPAVIISYMIGGLIAFMIMRQLGEMMTQEPIAGSFSNLAYKYWGDFPGLLSGWNYWILYVLVGMSELTAVGKYVQFWFPGMENWQTITIFFLIINAINLANVKVFGEMEFWFASIKVAAIIGMIILGGYLLISGHGGPEAQISNLWAHGGFFPKGAYGLLISLAIVMFSFGGLELVGIAAAETDDPQKTIPKAVNQIVYRVLLFYVLTIVVLLSLFPWNQIAEGGSPFVLIFDALGSQGVATVLNFVVLTAAISVYNGTSYGTSRMLLGLAEQGNAPRFLRKINQRGIPYTAILTSALVTLMCVVLNYMFPEKAFKLLMSLVVSAIVINWMMLACTHLKFKQTMQKLNKTTLFPAIAYPLSNYICIVFMLGILAIMWQTPEMQIAVLLIPVWIICLSFTYWLKQKKTNIS